MGITSGLVKSVFSKSRSGGTHDNNARSNVTEKRRWNSVRSYLCGDELNSVLAEEDSASFKSSEAMTFTQLSSVLAEKNSASAKSSELVTVTQLNSVPEGDDSCSVNCSEATVTQPIQDEQEDGRVKKLDHLASKAMEEEQAATIIQSAFRGFLARHPSEGTKFIVGNDSPNRESLGTSVQVQVGNSVKTFSAQEERTAFHHRTNQKLTIQVMKDDWDDSTVSSNISKMRIQNRLEATTRRERALAYAFSQQLRICSKKKETKLNGREPNMGWSWLERWMATRLPESSSVESCVSKPVEPIYRNQRFRTSKGLFDITEEEKESCGSNEVSVTFDGLSVKSASERDGCNPTTINRKTARSVSRRKTVPSYRCPKDYTKVKKEGSFKGDFKRQKALGKVGKENHV